MAQAESPDLASMFENQDQAEYAAEQLLPRTRAWKAESHVVTGGEARWIVKHWPRHKTHLCAERRWMKLSNKKKGRKR